MKQLITILFAFLSCASYAQFPVTHGQSNSHTKEKFEGAIYPVKGLINGRYADTATANLDYVAGEKGIQIIAGNTIWVRDSTATRWIAIGSGGVIPGGAITSLPELGDNPGTDITSNDFIINEFYKSQPPTATLTGGQTLELRSAQTMNYTLNWTAGRQSATDSLFSVVVATVPQTFSQPAAGDIISGTQDVSFPANTDTTFQNVVTTTDSKTATATTTFYFLPKRYYGWISDTTGIGTEGFDDSKITALGNELSASKIKSWNTGSPTGTQFYVYAYYVTAGELSHFDMNGFPSLEAMNHVIRNFTNTLGFTGQWIIYWNKNGQTLSSDIIAN